MLLLIPTRREETYVINVITYQYVKNSLKVFQVYFLFFFYLKVNDVF